MRKNEVFPYYRDYSSALEEAYNLLKSMYNTTYVDELCKLRGYVGEEQRALITELELGYCEIYTPDILGERRRELGLVSEKDYFLLQNRFIVPIYDITGKLVALVGWFDDVKKYITTPTVFFSKESLFFNIEHAFRLSWEKFNGIVFLVEGIFDCLSLRAIGLPVIATMGVTVKAPKSEQLKLFRKVIGIPDNDKAGRRALDIYSTKYGWQLPSGSTLIRMKGGTLETDYGTLHVKDMDNFVSWYDAESVREILLSFADSKNDFEDLII